jgi:hypothetical protein
LVGDWGGRRRDAGGFWTLERRAAGFFDVHFWLPPDWRNVISCLN